jgi:cellulose synthase/poly-beta-1,6-N-acetylglucosamine synthase-like glycosyltransferase
MIYAFYVFASLLLLQGVFSLIEGLKFLAFVRRSLVEPPASFKPKAAIIAPCKGIDKGLAENLRALFDQDYSNYEIVFVIASREDRARSLIEQAIAENPHIPARLIIAKPDNTRSEKVNNLLAAIDEVSQDCEALVFVDSDARVHTRWLTALISPLVNEDVGAATGYRWHLPERGGFWPAMLSAWNGAVATTLGDHNHNFAWGGSTAILRETFERVYVRQFWQRAVSDDYALTHAMRQSGLRIHFVPDCLIPWREDANLKSLVEFTTRQVTITRVYNARVWWLGIISHSLFCGVFFGGILFIMRGAIEGVSFTVSVSMLSLIYLLGSGKGLLRLIAAREAIKSARVEIGRLWWMFCLLWPLVSLLFLYNFLLSATTRRITWRGIQYEMISPTETIVIR